MKQTFARTQTGAPSLFQEGNCLELEGLAKSRGEAFTEYLSARHRLSCSEPGAIGHAAEVEAFEAACARLRLSQRNWEEHIAAHHIG